MWITNTAPVRHARRSCHRPAAFTLVELLTVVFIISLLIGILIPSLSAARTAAKKAVSAKTLKAIDVGLQMFKNDNESEYPQTNGYPPSFSHPPIAGYAFLPELGEFPFRSDKARVYGAMWLPAMLMGPDQQGYIKRSTVPNKDGLRAAPEKWYTPDPLGDGKLLERAPYYLDPDASRTVRLKDLPGRENRHFFPSWSTDDNDPNAYQNMTVIVDAFDYPILYYVANKNGRTTNMVAGEHDPEHNYEGGPQQNGVPFYFHDDNDGFTGHSDNGTGQEGWNFNGPHPIAETGADLDAAALVTDSLSADRGEKITFAEYIVDRKIFRDLKSKPDPDAKTPLRPVNADSYLLISPGPDGRYGTKDDVSNLPPFQE